MVADIDVANMHAEKAVHAFSSSEILPKQIQRDHYVSRNCD